MDLLYLSHLTIPYTPFCGNQVCQFMHQPSATHQIAVKRILRYLKRTPDHGLFNQLCSLRLEAYLDADYAVSCEPIDRCSLGGFCIYLVHSPIYWSPKKNRIVSHSRTKAESCQFAYTQLRFCGFSHYSQVWVSLNQFHLFTVTKLVQFLQPQTQFFMLEQNIRKQITIMCMKRLFTRSLRFATCSPGRRRVHCLLKSTSFLPSINY